MIDIDTAPWTGSASEFVAYEYTTIKVDRSLESLYRDAYRNFGWVVEGYGPQLPNVNTVSLKLKRDRRIKNRSMVVELQRTCEKALHSITSMERSKQTVAISAALVVGIVGSALLAGSVFALEGGITALSIVLGALGLVGWALGYLTYTRTQARRTERLAEQIDRQYDVVYDTGEQAAQLLA